MTGGYDAAITEGADPALRISNAVTSGSFGDQLFSPTLDVPATETGPARTFTASFVLEPVELQPGLRVTVSPDNGQGGRGGFLAIEHTNGGIDLVSQGSYFNAAGDTRVGGHDGGHRARPEQAAHREAQARQEADTKKSTNNDVFSVQVDGKPVKNTTFEAYYEATGEQNYQTDTLLFRLSGTAQPRSRARAC